MNAQLNIAVGEVHLIPLSNNAGTGFSWVVAENNAQITRVTIDTEPATGGGARVLGGPVKTMARIAGLQAGVSGIKLVQRRIWEPEQPPLDTLLCSVTVIKKEEMLGA
ncbi:MAG: protease inhibitor I42 family protein [Niabella sp.]|nr:protease inhibitor I42 family protein [Niabella sp.]